MDNFERHEAAQVLEDTMTPYALALRVLELTSKNVELEEQLKAAVIQGGNPDDV